MAGKGSSLAWKVLASLSAVAAGIAARKMLVAIVRKTTGKEPPANPESPETTWPEAFGFAVLSGVVLGVARLLARRSAARSWVRATGHLPPGLETVEPNSVLGLETNARFVEAYLVGLNFEMGRELLWRGYPTDQRGTYFERFWDARSSNADPDVFPLHGWHDRPLGDPQTAPSGDRFVMLIRSALLRRYPTAVIYAAKALIVRGVRKPSGKPEDEKHPAFRGSMQPDVSFFGFDMTVAQAVGPDNQIGRASCRERVYGLV